MISMHKKANNVMGKPGGLKMIVELAISQSLNYSGALLEVQYSVLKPSK